jgi:hypothetical protein
MPDIAIRCPKCSASRLVKEEWAGKNAKCACGASITIPRHIAAQGPQEGPEEGEEGDQVRLLRHILAALGSCSAQLQCLNDGILQSQESSAPGRPKQYKVLTQKDKWFTGKFDPELLERAMNAYSEQGWIIKAVTTASIPGFGGNREELIVVLER